MGTLWFPFLVVALIVAAIWVFPNLMRRIVGWAAVAGIIILAELVIGAAIIVFSFVMCVNYIGTDVETARSWLKWGLTVGLGLLIAFGVPTAVVLDGLGYIFLATPRQRIARVLKAYTSGITWLLLAGGGLYTLGVFTPEWAVPLAVIGIAGLVLGGFAWYQGLSWARPVAYAFFIGLVVTAIGASLWNFYYYTGDPQTGRRQFLARIESQQAKIGRERVLAGIQARMETNAPGTPEHESAVADLRRWDQAPLPGPLRWVEEKWEKHWWWK